MMRAVGYHDGRPVVMLGLEEENLRRLQNDKPIMVNLSRFVPNQDVELPDVEVVIFMATPEAVAMLRRATGAGTSILPEDWGEES